MLKLAISLVVGGALAITLPTFALEQPQPPTIPPAVLKPSKAIEIVETVNDTPEPEKPLSVPSTLPTEPIVTNVGDDNPVGSVESIVRQAAMTHGLDPDHFWAVAMCESSGNPNAVNYSYYENGHPSGLLQHLSGYWPARAADHGYPGASVFDVVANANVSASMWASGSSGLWACQG